MVLWGVIEMSPVNLLPKIALHCDFNARNVLERWSGFSENKLMQQTAILPFYLMYLSESYGNRIYGRIPSKLHLFMYLSMNLIVEFNFIQFRRVILYGQKPYNPLTDTCSEFKTLELLSSELQNYEHSNLYS